jgi:TatD DNase family protein
MAYSFIDTHCHLSDPKLLPDTADILQRAQAANVTKMISISCEPEHWATEKKIADEHENVFFSIGLHPCSATLDENTWQQLEEYAQHPKCVALGETGVDLYWPENPSLETQLECFDRHITLGKKLNKPLVVHLRDADEAFLNFLSDNKALEEVNFIIHCFASDWKIAKAVFAGGGMISFTGIITFKNAAPELLEVVKKAPLEKIMIETDAPYLTPHPHRGKRNEPSFVPLMAEKIAELKNMDVKEVAQQLQKNSEQFFGI